MMADEICATAQPQPLRYIDFYSGLGGWTMALRRACRENGGNEKLKEALLHCVAAFDHSDLCCDVYKYNFGKSNSRGTTTMKTKTRIEQLTVADVDNVHVWMMSPPCQPHTRQHENQAKELDDPRTASFLHLCVLLEKVQSPPLIILLENVVGFEQSQSWKRYQSTLRGLQYSMGQFVLQPHQVGIPNDRPRFYAVAILYSRLLSGHPLAERYFSCSQHELSSSTAVSSYLTEERSQRLEPIVHSCIPELNVIDREKSDVPRIREFLLGIDEIISYTPCGGDNDNDNDIKHNYDTKQKQGLQVPTQVLERSSAWCFDIVTPHSRRSSCFTSGYGRHVKGTGSILYDTCGNHSDEKDEDEILLLDPADREFRSDWKTGMESDRLRYFSGQELAQLFGFDASFEFPPHVTTKQQWKLMGNSLNVIVASKLVKLAFAVSI